MKNIMIALLAFSCTPLYAQHSDTLSFCNTLRVEATDTSEEIIVKAAHIVPTPRQWEAQKNEFIAFVHFGPNTFTRMEWGTGKESPRIFDLQHLDTDQWCEAMKSAGMKMVILTVKHHDGFVLWQSRYTRHGIMSTGYKDGKGDVLKELSESCRKYGLKLGVYLSPADLFQIESPDGLYGNGSRPALRTIPREVPGRPFENKTRFELEVDDYNEYFLNQLFELLTEYGPIHEVWFDGAHPKRKGGQKYNYKAWRELIRTLAPEATIFGREDVRWCGNEAGYTRESEWNVIGAYEEDPAILEEFRDLYGDLGTREVILTRERPYYLHYQPAETNTSIREGWFYRDEVNQRVRSADDVFDIYERSVGGNSIFLLNIPPNREGRFSTQDVDVLKEVGKRISETYGHDLLANADGPQAVLDNRSDTYLLLDDSVKEILITLPHPVTFNRLLLQEAVETHSERVESHAVDAWIDGHWQEIARGTNIGYKRILRFQDVTTTKLRFRVDASRLSPAISKISAHYYRQRPPLLQAERDSKGEVTITPKINDFSWENWNKVDGRRQTKPENVSPASLEGVTIRYTTDGTAPDATSTLYTGPFRMENCELQVAAWKDGERGAVCRQRFGLVKEQWKVQEATGSSNTEHPASAAFDELSATYWLADSITSSPVIFCVDLGKTVSIAGFAYTPQLENKKGLIAEGHIELSLDGKHWTKAEDFFFGNLINDPTKRYHYFQELAKGRYFKIVITDIAGGDSSVSMAELDIYSKP